MSKDQLAIMNSFTNLNDLLSFIGLFYPNLSVKEKYITEIEAKLHSIYFKLILHLYPSCPAAIQAFIRNYFLKYEIWNLKIIILGILTDMDRSQIRNRLINEIETLYNRDLLFARLANCVDLSEFMQLIKKTPYHKVLKQGIEFYNNTGEIFLAELDLDRYFHKNLVDSLGFYPENEKKTFEPFILSLADIFNLRLISRSLFNNIDRKLIEPYILDYGYYLKSADRESFFSLENFQNYYATLIEYFSKKGVNFPKIGEFKEDIPLIDEFIFEGLFRKMKQAEIDDINNITLIELFGFIFKKELEIRFVLKKLIQIIHGTRMGE